MAYIEKVNKVYEADATTTFGTSYVGLEVKDFAGSDKAVFRVTTGASATTLTIQANGLTKRDLVLTVGASKTYYLCLDIAMYRKATDNKVYFKGDVASNTVELIKLH